MEYGDIFQDICIVEAAELPPSGSLTRLYLIRAFDSTFDVFSLWQTTKAGQALFKLFFTVIFAFKSRDSVI